MLLRLGEASTTPFYPLPPLSCKAFPCHLQWLASGLFVKQKFAILTTVGTLLTKELLYSSMKSVKLKAYLNQIADRLTEDSTLEDVYEQLSLLADIDESEEQVEKGEILTQKEVEEQSKEWLK